MGPIFEYGAMGCDRSFSVEHFDGNDISVWNGVLGPIFESGAVWWDR